LLGLLLGGGRGALLFEHPFGLLAHFYAFDFFGRQAQGLFIRQADLFQNIIEIGVPVAAQTAAAVFIRPHAKRIHTAVE
jgi:hypothetical protein